MEKCKEERIAPQHKSAWLGFIKVRLLVYFNYSSMLFSLIPGRNQYVRVTLHGKKLHCTDFAGG